MFWSSEKVQGSIMYVLLLTQILGRPSYPIEKITRRDRWPPLPSTQSHPMVMATVTVGLHLRLSLPRSTQMRSATRGAVVNSRFTSPLLSQFAVHPLTQPHLTFFSSYSLPHQHPRGIYSPLSSATEEGALIEEEELEEVVEDPTLEVRYLDPEAEAERITEWEVDFCSRPIFDERGKKIWELVVCDATLSLQFTRYFPNNVINSVTLKDAISDICSSLNVPLPFKIRFFRSQMQTIITKACNELGIKPIPSKRCISLQLWLEERYETVYSRHPGFQKGFKPLLSLDNPFAMKLPENLFGDKWAFVQLPFSAVQDEVSSIYKRYAFGQGLDLDLLGFEFDDNTLVPGLAVASTRAKALAAWMNGLEICAVEVDKNNANLILSVGVSTRYVYASYQKNATTTQEAEAWESAKKACSGLHFLAIQETLDSEGCVGFWLLLDLPPPPV